MDTCTLEFAIRIAAAIRLVLEVVQRIFPAIVHTHAARIPLGCKQEELSVVSCTS